ncbi:MAG TPA: FGGY family carbohydrate kinase, partial [Gaiellales bacterium]|nr:FGGY family carbohydrate kinase [Gaiellales bacterium]
MTAEAILALDQGSSSTRCVAYDRGMRVIGSATRPVTTSRPAPGMVEHDPADLLDGALAAVGEAATPLSGRIAALGIADQTESFVIWERETGRAVSPVVSWQDTRAADVCRTLSGQAGAAAVPDITGLALEPTFSAPKLRWLFDRDPALQRRAEAGELLFGDVACWLAWHLSGGALHVTEPSNACRTMLLGLDSLAWDERMLDLFGIPAQLLPTLRPSDAPGMETSAGVTGFEAPISAMLGDQPAALFGQGCMRPGMAALTLGTGAFLWLNAGPDRPEPPEGVLATVAWDRSDRGRAYALEAFCANAGNALGV